MTTTKLYAITPPIADDARLQSAAAATLRGGARMMQYRNPDASAQAQKRQATMVAALCRHAGAQYIINDSVELAQAIGADGVHLGVNDTPIATARQTLGAGKIIGATCHNDIARAHRAIAAGADYVAFGALFASPTKPDAIRCSLKTLQQARAKINAPIVAIGGINADNIAAVAAIGVAAIAVCDALFAAPQIQIQTQTLIRLIHTHSPTP